LAPMIKPCFAFLTTIIHASYQSRVK
jgi:hypothetical protein